MVFAGNNNNTLVANARTVREFDIQKVNTNFKEAFKCDSKKVGALCERRAVCKCSVF